MKFIPLVLIITGGIMIWAGINKQNPVAVVKSVLTNTPLSGAATPPSNIGGGPAPNPNPAPKPGG